MGFLICQGHAAGPRVVQNPANQPASSDFVLICSALLQKTYNNQVSGTYKPDLMGIELLRIYKKLMVRAETLLSIFELERSKRTRFAYHRIGQANQEPAKESVDNAGTYLWECAWPVRGSDSLRRAISAGRIAQGSLAQFPSHRA